MYIDEFNAIPLKRKTELLWGQGKVVSHWVNVDKTVILFWLCGYYAEMHYKVDCSGVEQIMTIAPMNLPKNYAFLRLKTLKITRRSY